jgi:hypothetical protein
MRRPGCAEIVIIALLLGALFTPVYTYRQGHRAGAAEQGVLTDSALSAVQRQSAAADQWRRRAADTSETLQAVQEDLDALVSSIATESGR